MPRHHRLACLVSSLVLAGFCCSAKKLTSKQQIAELERKQQEMEVGFSWVSFRILHCSLRACLGSVR